MSIGVIPLLLTKYVTVTMLVLQRHLLARAKSKRATVSWRPLDSLDDVTDEALPRASSVTTLQAGLDHPSSVATHQGGRVRWEWYPSP